MSEYQYYEFQAVDRPLNQEQMAKLREISSRAEITPTRMTNVYSYGDFRGDPAELLSSYFDAHVYEANWGSHTLMFAFPKHVVDVEAIKAYRVDAVSDYETGLMVVERSDRVIVTFASHEEEYGGWIDESESESWLPSMLSLREDIIGGDLRTLYLGWLAGATLNLDLEIEVAEGEDPDEFSNVNLAEPLVPAGLGQLTPALKKLAEFLRLDDAMIDVAAERSAPLRETRLSEKAIRGWIADLPGNEKDELLLRLIKGEARIGAELVRRLRTDLVPKSDRPEAGEPRTAGDLAAKSKDRAVDLERRAKAEAARKRSEYLDSVASRANEIWRHADDLAEQKQGRTYDEAAALLGDLHEVAVRDGKAAPFERRIQEFRERHVRKPALVERLRKLRLIK